MNLLEAFWTEFRGNVLPVLMLLELVELASFFSYKDLDLINITLICILKKNLPLPSDEPYHPIILCVSHNSKRNTGELCGKKSLE